MFIHLTRIMAKVHGNLSINLCLFFFTLVEVLGFTIILPLFPYLTKDIMSPVEVGYLSASNALCQMIATPIMGSLSDKYGRRPLLLLSVASTFISFLILANAETRFWFFFSRILDGLLGGNLALARAYVTDVTTDDKEARLQGMGIIGSAYGFGHVLGPILGGLLLSYHHGAPGYASAIISLLNLVCLWFFLPESLPLEKRCKKSIIIFSFGQTLSDLFRICGTNTKIMEILMTRYTFTFILVLFQYSFTFFNAKNDPRTAGLLLCWFSLVYSLSQSYGTGILLRRIDERSLFRYTINIQPFCYAILYATRTNGQMFISLVPLALTSGILNTMINLRTSAELEKVPGIVGGGLGLSSAVGSLARMIAPPSAGFFIQYMTDSCTLFLYCAFFSTLLLLTMFNQMREILL